MIDSVTRLLVQGTWNIARRDPDKLTKLFYGRLFEVAPGVRPLFPTEMAEQQAKLAAVIDVAVTNLANVNTILMDLQQMAERHIGYGAEPEHYPVVGQTLLWALEQHLGDEFLPEVREAWAETYGLIAKVMVDAHEAAIA